MTRTATILVLACLAASAFGAVKSINHDLTPATDGDFVFVVAGDNRPTTHGAPYPRVFDTVLSEIRVIQPALVLWTGDTVYGYGDKDRAELANEYATFLRKAANADVPIFNAPGNHEVHPNITPCDKPDVCEEEFKAHFGDLYGSFDYRGVHFIALDTEEIGHEEVVDGKKTAVQIVDGDQLKWLKEDLEAHKNARAIFAFFHTELTPAPNDEDGNGHPPLGNASDIRSLFAKYHVKAVFQGHEHLLYAPDPKTTEGVRYFVAGGAGAPMYARPENGGVSSYIVVEMKGSDATFNIVEPGRFYVQGAGDVVWLINSNDVEIPARRIEATVPAAVGKCGALAFDQTLAKKFDGEIREVSCKPSGA
ncbi:MAG TPA: metallophosphoesterase, partial [Thermoanaerobaculia bacterium]|nr:metallophosphoesterase [Thermoanaerobaculia bacterium]